MKMLRTSMIPLSTLAVILALASAAIAARPVARWDVVPDQLIEAPFAIGVVAFHLEGVKVEFRVNGQWAATAADPARNPRTGVWEYFFTLDPAACGDGAVTVDARAVCLSGSADDPDYDLPTLTFYANAGGTLSPNVERWVDPTGGSDANPGTEAAPYATLAKGVKNTPAGGTVYLMPGSYDSQSLAGGTRPYWTTITPADGVSRDQVVIGIGRPSTQRLKWKGVSFITNSTGTYGGFLIGENGNHLVWTDDCRFENTAGRWNGSLEYFTNRYVAYVTGGESSNMANGPGAGVVRDHVIRTLKSDAWSGGGKLVVNSAVYDIDPGSTGAHPDFHQSYAAAPDFVENVILYNVRGIDCDSQGLFGSRLRHAAFVNVLFERVPNVYGLSQYSGPMENVLFAHVSLVRQNWLWRGVGTNALAAADVNVVNCLFNSMSYAEDAQPQPGLVIDHNHFASGTPQGTSTTAGDMMYIDVDANDFRIDPASPAAGNGRLLQCVPADIDGDPYDPAGRNRGCYAAPAPAAAGDADGDGDVDLDDFVILKRNFGTPSGATAGMGDFDGDGDVDLDDFVILKQNFGA
ncbi:MAG: DUF1565 domain-containing protein [Planctomycetes bacterium]|nr:DUF1565 domain-containing protein [Planctomycetota bacterium]